MNIVAKIQMLRQPDFRAHALSHCVLPPLWLNAFFLKSAVKMPITMLGTLHKLHYFILSTILSLTFILRLLCAKHHLRAAAMNKAGKPCFMESMLARGGAAL